MGLGRQAGAAWQELLARRREKGTWPLLKLGFERVVPPHVLGFGSVVVLSVPLPGKIPSTEGFDEVRWAGLDDVESMSRLGMPADVLRRRFERGARAAIREQEGRVVAYHWYDTERFHMHHFRVRMAPGDVYAYDALTERSARGRRVFHAVFAWAKRDLHAAGSNRSVTAVMSSNRNSLRLCLGQGWREIGRIRYATLLGLTVARAGGRTFIGRTGGRHRLDLSIEGLRG